MNEELKVIISAEIGKLQNELGKANKQVSGFEKKTKSSSGKVGKAFHAIGIAAKAVGGVVAKAFAAMTKGVAAAITAIVAVSAATKEYRDNLAKLNTAYEASGSSAQQAAKTYNDLYRFLGDSDTATEAANLLAKLTTNEQELAEWTTALQGVYATFPDSLPIESLAEAANETAKVGKVTGTLADALNWAGVSEDAFNASLAATNSEAEREALIRNTLNGLYGDAALRYEENNQAMIRQNEAKARLTATMAKLAKSLEPVILALTNMANTLLTVLAPAINAVVPYLVTFINYISIAVQWIAALFGALSGKGAQAADNLANNAKDTADGFKTASTGANKLNGNLGNAAKTAEKIKRSLAGFDELNVLSSGNDSSSSSSGTGAAGGGIGAAAGGITIDTSQLENGLTVSQQKVEAAATAIKTAFKSIGDFFKKVGEEIIEYLGLFEPSFGALKDAAVKLKQPFINFGKSVGGTFKNLLNNSVIPLYKYFYATFVPNLTNAVTTNLVPAYSDIMVAALEEFATTFEWLGGIVNSTVNDIIIPAVQSVEGIVTDALVAVKENWDKNGGAFLANLQTALASVRDILTQLYEGVIKPVVQYVLDAITELWENKISGLWAGLLEFFASLSEAILTIWNNFLAPIVNWLLENVVPKIVEYIKLVIDNVKIIVGIIVDVVAGVIKALSGLLDFITGVFSGNWEKAWNGIKKFFTGIWDAIVGIVDGAIKYIENYMNMLIATVTSTVEIVVAFLKLLWEQIVKIFTPVINFLKEVFTKAWNGVKNVFAAVGNFFVGVFNSIKNAFASVGTFFKDTFTNAWNGVKNVFNNVKSFFEGIWDKIKGVFSDIGTKISDAISGSVKTAINNVLGGAAKIINGFIDAINFAIDVLNAVPGVSISKLSRMEVPKLATGGIVDKATLAVVGERGKEAVLPLENNTGWMDMLADRLSQRSNSPSKIVLMLDGKELGWASINSINDITKQTGNLQLTMA